MIQIAVMGHGVVGSGVVEVFQKNYKSIRRKIGDDAQITRILDLRDFPGCGYEDKFTKNFEDIVSDPQISIVAEVMGGLHPAFEFVKECLERGKSVVSSNKELVAQKGAELLELARCNHVNFFFEASVGGGIPIIRPLHQCLAANEIDEIAGILNGTTNFILTKMIREQMEFSHALALAQQLGYAERDPSADVQGLDACRKICILASLAFGRHVYPQDVPTQGIGEVTPQDVAYAEDWGGVIKLIGRAKRLENGKLDVCVGPMFLSGDSQLASVDDVFNGILVRGDATGDVVFYGKGAGKLPTASAVVADIIDAAKASDTCSTLYWRDTGEAIVEDAQTVSCARYVRLEGTDCAHWQCAQELLQVQKRLYRGGEPPEQRAYITHPLSGNAVSQAREQLGRMGIQMLSCMDVLDD